MSAPEPNELGDTLKRAADAATPSAIDVDEVLRRSRARRRARRTAVVGGAGALAGVLVVGSLVLGIQRAGAPTTADGPAAFESAESDGAPESAEGGAADDATGLQLTTPEQVNRCGARVAAPTDAATSPLAVDVTVPTAAVPSATSNRVTVTLTNTGTEPVTGEVAAVPPLTVADDGITVWHSSPGDDDRATRPITLGPGESTSLEGAFETLACDEADELGERLPADLPGLEPGAYAVSAVVWLSAPDGAITPLVSPLVPITVE